MLNLVLALLAGVVTIAALCTLPMLPILLGASVGQTSKVRPALIALGFIVSFSAAALLLGFTTRLIDFDPNVLRTAAITLLFGFGLLMIWPAPFEWLSVRIGGLSNGATGLGAGAGHGDIGGFILGTTLGLVWTPCAGPVLGSILTIVATSKDTAPGPACCSWSTPSALLCRCLRSPMAGKPSPRACAALRGYHQGCSRVLEWS
jgi:cytochrome c-type biogenesis protein